MQLLLDVQKKAVAKRKAFKDLERESRTIKDETGTRPIILNDEVMAGSDGFIPLPPQQSLSKKAKGKESTTLHNTESASRAGSATSGFTKPIDTGRTQVREAKAERASRAGSAAYEQC